jgi:UDP-N-acetyl-D-galactosamine dehydrogenase
VREYGITLSEWDALPAASAIVAAVAHDAYRRMPPGRFLEKLAPNGVFIDVKSCHDKAAIEAAGVTVWRL